MKTVIGMLLAIAIGAGVASAAMSSSKSLTIVMKAQNGSGENGTAVISPAGKGVKVAISLTGAPATAQPAHIHPGTCAKLNPSPKYVLNPVVHGKSTTFVANATMSSLMNGMFAINVHESLTNLAKYVSCGDIK